MENCTLGKNMENITRIEIECKYQYVMYGISINSSCQKELPHLTS